MYLNKYFSLFGSLTTEKPKADEFLKEVNEVLKKDNWKEIHYYANGLYNINDYVYGYYKNCVIHDGDDELLKDMDNKSHLILRQVSDRYYKLYGEIVNNENRVDRVKKIKKLSNDQLDELYAFYMIKHVVGGGSNTDLYLAWLKDFGFSKEYINKRLILQEY
jgi:hypothetical protein